MKYSLEDQEKTVMLLTEKGFELYEELNFDSFGDIIE